jgi:hypothetical protein
MRSLDEIALSYGTDKSSLSHNYTKLYTLYFESVRNQPLNILEIGIDKGYSLKSWKEYFPNATITGLDILDLSHFAEDRANVVVGSQSDIPFLQETNEKYGPFDIIIDDGSHHNSDMKASFECLFPLLKEGGIYVVEDLHACYWGDTAGTGEPVFIDTLKLMIDAVNASGKSGTADRAHDIDDSVVIHKPHGPMTYWEQHVEFVHIYRSIVFIKKYPPTYLNADTERAAYLTVNDIRPPAYKDSLPKRLFYRYGRRTKHILKKVLGR